MSGAAPERRNVWIPPAHWDALRRVAELNHTSISAVLRAASERHLERYGLSIIGDELTINPLLWPATEDTESSQHSESGI